ncbi:hypothetical protein CANCADRAFT_25309 [Tortispora caseinolytica NRRL Y-17796]|uniref:Mitochondrial carrier n=1 Tax=Tortispora caseinolytica NRRL Y-17796 TaxID=767744 RepID=A0A1E4TEN2_9ASCO|nr:hypothetical protein CANCADRAFT_25309 [Tortispora caseinolytica NRRL Y-17796]
MSDSAEIDTVIESNPFVEQIKSFVAGGVGGVCSVLTGHPFDLLKVRLQTASPGQYAGTLDALKKTIAHDGPKGLYRGVTAPLLGVTPMFAISFWGYDLGKQIVTATTPTGPGGSLSIAQISAAGFISAIPTTAVAAPFERVKVLLQVQGQDAPKPRYNGTFDVVKHLYREGGLRSIFKGSVATVARDGPGSALYFATYEYLKRSLTPKDAEMSFSAILFSGGMAGVSMWLVVFPLDTIKSTLQSQEGNANFVNITRQIYSKGGIKAFFPGIGPALLRSFPANAATFLGVELTHRAFGLL